MMLLKQVVFPLAETTDCYRRQLIIWTGSVGRKHNTEPGPGTQVGPGRIKKSFYISLYICFACHKSLKENILPGILKWQQNCLSESPLR